jgi:hypothetical protein
MGEVQLVTSARYTFQICYTNDRICDSRLGNLRKFAIGLDVEERSFKMAFMSFDILGGLKSCFYNKHMLDVQWKSMAASQLKVHLS